MAVLDLVIRARSLNHDSVAQSIVGEFDKRGGTIGRSDSNTMTLPDPERHVSRLQAEVSFGAGTYSLRNVGSANPIIVNGRPLDPGDAVALRHQDQLVIGGYELRVDLQTPAGRAPRAAIDARTVIGASAREEKTGPPRRRGRGHVLVSAGDPFADLLGAAAKPGAVDPFADLLRPASPPVAAQEKPRPPPAVTAAAPPRLPDDFDPFADAAEASSAQDAQPPPLQDMLGPDAFGPGLDEAFGLQHSRGASPPTDPVADFLSPGPTEAAASITDPFAFLDRRVQPVGPAEADDTPDLNAAYEPPPVQAAKPARRPPPPIVPKPPVPRPPDVDDAALWDALCDGAQLTLPQRQRLTPELMRVLGSTLRQAVEGTLQLSAMRTLVKQELHVPVTTIRAKDNNPLKFAPDATAALAQMLQPPMRGFMAAPEAMRDAMTDLLGHAVGSMEGMRAAMQGILERFEPARLEAQLAAGGVLDKLMPGNRRAQLWALYLQHYGRISDSAREDFDELFGKAFVKAYEDHADRVAASRRSRR